MPRIDTPLLLDILLGLVVLFFIPFGIRRGAAKEAMASAGILLGGTLAERFSQRWGAEISARWGWESGAATFAVAATLLFATTALLGYGGGAAIGALRPGVLSRLVGGLLAAINATLLLSYLVGWIDQYLRQGGALDDGTFARALLTQDDLFLLGAALLLLALTVGGWIVNAARSRRQPRAANGSVMTGMPPRQRPVRVANAGDAGKYEPEIEATGRSGRFSQRLDATSPLRTGPAFAADDPWANDGQGTRTPNGHGHESESDNTRSRHANLTPKPTDETTWSAWSASRGAESFSATEPIDQWPRPPSIGVSDDERCAVCHAQVGPRDVFCPECGATL